MSRTISRVESVMKQRYGEERTAAKDGKTLPPIPKRVRGAKVHGDTVRIRIGFNAL